LPFREGVQNSYYSGKSFLDLQEDFF
jgi:hypothetical protein